MSQKNGWQILSAEFPDELAERMRIVSALMKCSKSDFIRVSVKERLDKLGFPVNLSDDVIIDKRQNYPRTKRAKRIAKELKGSLSQSEIARRNGVSAQRVNQIKKREDHA